MKPNSYQKVIWDIFIGVVYLMCFWLDPFCLGTAFRIYEEFPNLNSFQRWLTILLVIDMAMVPMTAMLKKESIMSKMDKKNKGRIQSRMLIKRGKDADLGLNDPLLERDIKVLCISYIKREFIFDCAANVPIFLYEALRGWPTDPETMGKL